MVEFIDHEVELITKKNSAPKKPTAKQLEGEQIKDAILSLVDTENGKTATMLTEELQSSFPGVSRNRVTSMLSQLVEDNSVVRTVVKRTPFFFSI